MKILVCLICFTYFVEWSVCQSTTQINLYYHCTKILRESYSVKEKNNAIKSGEFKQYSKDGNLIIAGQYSNNVKSGEWFSYHEDGSLKSTSAYNDGKLVNDYKLYSKGGILILAGPYINNIKSGKWHTYHDDGSLKLISVYDNGTLINETKHGIWTSTEEKGKVRKVIDYSKSTVPEYYYDIRFNYPALDKEHGIQGFVNLEINTDNYCNIKSMIVKDSIGYGCEKEVIVATRELIKYMKKYQIDSCRNLTKVIPFKFNLSN